MKRERKISSIQPVSQMGEGLACLGLQSPEEVRGEQGSWLLAQWSNGHLCDHRQLVISPCPLHGPTGRLDERQDLVRYQMVFLNGIFQGQVNNCAFMKGLMHSYQNVRKWCMRLTTVSLNSLVCCHLKIFYDLGSVRLDSIFHSAVFFLSLWVFLGFSIGEGAEFICESHKTDFESFSFFVSKVEDMLDICTGRELGRDLGYCFV